MGRGGYLTNEERIKKDEAELEEMKKKLGQQQGYQSQMKAKPLKINPVAKSLKLNQYRQRVIPNKKKNQKLKHKKKMTVS